MIDVIVTCFNAEEFIENSLGSVLMQENASIHKIIIVDDASTDATVFKCKAFIESNVNCSFELIVNDSNLGPFLSLKKALSFAESKYVAILEGDDFWLDAKKVFNQLNFLQNNKDFSAIGGNSKVVNMKGEFIGEAFGSKNSCELSIEDVIGIPPFQLSSILFDRSYLPEFPDYFKGTFSNDKLIYSTLALNSKIHYDASFVAAYRLNSNGITMSAGINARYKEHTYFYEKLNEFLFLKYTHLIHQSIFRHQLGYLQKANQLNVFVDISYMEIIKSWVLAQNYKKIFAYKELLYAFKLKLL